MLKDEERICGIYKITNNINNRCYIGKSECNVYKRLEEHKKKTHNDELRADFEKYGLENFSFEVIELCDRDACGKLEVQYIAKFKSNNKKYGYNKTSGDERHGTRFSEDAIEKIRKSSTGRFNSEETREKKRQGRLGKKHSEKSKNKMREIAKNRVITEETEQKRIEGIKKYVESLSEDERKERFDHSSGMFWVNNGDTRIQVDEYELNTLLKNGWERGMKIPGKEIVHKKSREETMSKEKRVESYGHEKGKVFMTNGEQIIKIEKDKVPEYELLGFKRGMKLK